MADSANEQKEALDLARDPLSKFVWDFTSDAITAHASQTQQHLQDYRDRERIARAGDHKGSGLPTVRKAKSLFFGLVRDKCRINVAKIGDTVFGQYRWPIDTEPLDESMRDLAALNEEMACWRFAEMQLDQVTEDAIEEKVLFGTGFLVGPFLRTKEIEYLEVVKAPKFDKDGAPVMDEQGFPVVEVIARNKLKHKYKEPYMLHAHTLDVFPDPRANNAREGRGTAWVQRMDPLDLKDLGEVDGFSNKEITEVLRTLPTSASTTDMSQHGSELARDEKGNITGQTIDGRVAVLYFMGKVRADMIAEFEKGNEVDPSMLIDAMDDPDILKKRVEALVVVAGNRTIRAGRVEDDERPIYPCYFERDTYNPWGTGIGKNAHTHQVVFNQLMRMYMETKGLAMSPPWSVARDLYKPGQQFQRFPGVIYEFKANVTPEERASAVMQHATQDISDGLLKPMEIVMQLLEDNTATSKYSSGEGLEKTPSGGIAMIMAAGNQPMKKVVRNIDRMWIAPILKRINACNIKYLDPKTVEIFFGVKKSAQWKAIQDYGDAAWMKWKTTGVSTFIAKEILTQKLMGFISVAGANPQMSERIDWTEVGNQTWDVFEMGKTNPILSDADLAKRKQNMGPDPVMIKIQADMEVQSRKLDIMTQEVMVANKAVDTKLALGLQQLQVKLEKIERDSQKGK